MPGRSGTWTAPLLLGSLVGSLVAGRVDVAAACAALAALLAAVAGARRPGRRWWVFTAWGSLIAVLLNLYLVDGAALALPEILGRPATAEGLRLGALLSLRLVGAAIAVHGLGAAWPGEQAADQIAGLLRPLERLRIPVSEARTVMGLALRFVPLLAHEVHRIDRLQALRAGTAQGAIQKLRRMQLVAVPALVGALERAEQVALSLEARHYRARRVSGARIQPVAGLAGLAVAGAAFLLRG
jgi:energy-coupling factor transport system permease protein